MAKKIQLTKNSEDVYPVTIPDAIAGLAEVAKTGNYNDLLNRPGMQSPMVSTSYAALLALRDGGTLVPGVQYRITDYHTTTVQSGSRSANHQFDVIVTADGEHTLNENARAIRHANDTYFSNGHLEAWELKYCIDNDTARFVWADTTNGKGVIYWMRDEWDNTAFYDFKNIQFLRDVDWFEDNEGWSESVFGETPEEDMWFYFLTAIDEGEIKDASLIGNYLENDEGKISGVFGNHDSQTSEYDIWTENTSVLALSRNCFVNTVESNTGYFFGCLSNSFEPGCCNNTFGGDCWSNILGPHCYNNVFGDNCSGTVLEEDCYNIALGESCYNITLGNNCISTKIGDNCTNITVGNCCNNITVGNICFNITVGNCCNNITVGNNCFNITFGNNCTYIRFGNSSSIKSNYNDIVVESNNTRIYLYCSSTTSYYNPYQNVRIVSNANNTSGWKTITDTNVKQNFTTVYQPTDSQIISI